MVARPTVVGGFVLLAIPQTGINVNVRADARLASEAIARSGCAAVANGGLMTKRACLPDASVTTG